MTTEAKPFEPNPATGTPVQRHKTAEELKEMTPDQLEQETDRTQSRIGENLEEVYDRLNPVDFVKSSVDHIPWSDIASSIGRFAKRNAVGSGLILGGIILSVLTDDESKKVKHAAKRTSLAAQRTGLAAKRKGEAAKQSVQDKLSRSDDASSLSDHELEAYEHEYRTGEEQPVTDRLAEYWSSGTDRVYDGSAKLAHSAKEAAGQGVNAAMRRPFVTGLAALAAGVAIGALIPKTRTENKAVGEYADDTKSWAKQRAEQAREHLSETGSPAERAQRVAGAAVQAAEEQAEHETHDMKKNLQRCEEVETDKNDSTA